MMGEMSMAPPSGGTTRRIGSMIGRAMRVSNCTMGLSGSGLTQDSRALAMMA